MARYDVAWGRRPWGGYDRPFTRGPAGPPWEGEGYGGDAPTRRYDREYAGGDGETAFGAGGIYGPGRYGLGPYHSRLRRQRRSDSELKQEVEEALFYDTWVDADAVQVEVTEGVVILRGELPNYEEIRYATDDAWDVDGVVGVRSELRVRGR